MGNITDLRKIISNCHKATFLIEKKQIGTITTREEIELRIHMVGCSVCRLFRKQSLLINQMMRNIFHAKEYREIQLDDDFKIDLQSKIDEMLNRGNE